MSGGGRRKGVPAAVLLQRRQRAARWNVAHMLLNEAVGELVSLDRLGAWIAEKLPWYGDGQPVDSIDKSIVSRIEAAKIDATPEVVDAFCAVLREHGVKDVTPGWITYAQKPAPRHPLSRDA